MDRHKIKLIRRFGGSVARHSSSWRMLWDSISSVLNISSISRPFVNHCTASNSTASKAQHFCCAGFGIPQ